MLSGTFSAELRCDETLRRVVMLSGVAAVGLGVAVIVTLPLHASLKLLAVAGWLAAGGIEYYRMRRAYALFVSVRIDANGDAWLCDRAGNWRGAQLLSGSVLMRRYGWLRVASHDGIRYAEPLKGHCRKSPDWRRLQVVWRHVGAVT